MVEPYIGEIRMFAGNFAPRAWAFCDGQLMGVSQNDALFSLLGTYYGGDGRTTFGLPEMRGRIPMHFGSGPGLTPQHMAQKSGSESVALHINEMPAHTHAQHATSAPATKASPGGNVLADTSSAGKERYNAGSGDLAAMQNNLMSTVGNGMSHTNLMPTLCINFIIALYGIYPSRS